MLLWERKVKHLVDWPPIIFLAKSYLCCNQLTYRPTVAHGSGWAFWAHIFYLGTCLEEAAGGSLQKFLLPRTVVNIEATLYVLLGFGWGQQWIWGDNFTFLSPNFFALRREGIFEEANFRNILSKNWGKISTIVDTNPRKEITQIHCCPNPTSLKVVLCHHLMGSWKWYLYLHSIYELTGWQFQQREKIWSWFANSCKTKEHFFPQLKYPERINSRVKNACKDSWQLVCLLVKLTAPSQKQ